MQLGCRASIATRHHLARVNASGPTLVVMWLGMGAADPVFCSTGLSHDYRTLLSSTVV